MTPRPESVLLPCPFCGEAGGIAGHDNENGPVYYVKCDVCESEGPGDSVELDAIARWNTRAQPEAEALLTLADAARNLHVVFNSGGLRGRPSHNIISGWPQLQAAVAALSRPTPEGKLTFGDGVRAAAQMMRDLGHDVLADKIRKLEDQSHD